MLLTGLQVQPPSQQQLQNIILTCEAAPLHTQPSQGKAALWVVWERLKYCCWHPIKQESETQKTKESQPPALEGQKAMEDVAALQHGQNSRQQHTQSLLLVPSRRSAPLCLGYLGIIKCFQQSCLLGVTSFASQIEKGPSDHVIGEKVGSVP